MSSSFIPLGFLLASLISLAVLVFRKMPALLAMPEEKKVVGEEKENPVRKFFAKLPFLKNFSFELFLQKIISYLRILTMKTENKTFDWLQKLRERAKDKFQKEDNYWEEVKKAKSAKRKTLK